jgi:hypothetical protein
MRVRRGHGVESLDSVNNDNVHANGWITLELRDHNAKVDIVAGFR